MFGKTYMKFFVDVIILSCLTILINCLMLRKECPAQEVHKSCSFRAEHICWTNSAMTQRSKIIPPRFITCQDGCYCSRGLVRAYPGGQCIYAARCRNMELIEAINKLPTGFPNLRNI